MAVKWSDLNKRQQAYMKAIYETDQAQEKEEREAFTFNRVYNSRPADVWRRMDYVTLDGMHKPLKMALYHRKLIDEGTGSTFEALEQRGLIECSYETKTREGVAVLSPEPFLSVRITRTGRKIVREALDIKPYQRPTFSDAQQGLINGIVAYAIAPLEEVQSAFIKHNDDLIEGWKSELRKKRNQSYREHLESLTRHEPCAYPGCPNTIEVRKIDSEFNETPEPTRTVTISMEMEGWSWHGFVKEQNSSVIQKHYYGCSVEHQEAIWRLTFELVSHLDMDKQRDIEEILYPIDASHEAHWKTIELARKIAWRVVAESDVKALAHIRRTIGIIAERYFNELVAASPDPEHLTDNMERFKTMYIEQFTEGYLDGLRIRKRIDDGNIKYYVGHEVWVKYHEQRKSLS